MQINELLLKNFGKFHDRQINLEEGINLIHGENESGKSTIHTFIKGMLFGIERGRGRAAQNDTFSIYEPWDNPNYYSGTLKFASGGKHFRIERNFDKYSKKAELVCIEDGEVLSVEDGDLRMLLGEMNVDRYENTVSMSQRNAQMGESMAMELKNYATNYYTSGNGEIDLNGALEQLKGRKKALENEIRMEMSRKQQKREKLEQEVSFIWRDVHHLEEELDRVEEELEYRAGKEEEKRKERQLEGEHGKGVMDEIRPEKWRIHPMEILIFALVIVAAVIILSRPWNYLVAIVLFLAFGLYVWNRMKVGKKQVKTEPEIILEEITQAAEHLEQLSGAMRGYLKRDLNEKASAIIREITGGKYTKLVTDEKLHVSLVTDEKLVEIEQVSRGTVEQIYLALRMAVGELLCEEEMPVILDDVFAYYDEERMLQTLKWLKAHKKQVLLFTCQKREEQVMKEAGIAYHKIEL